MHDGFFKVPRSILSNAKFKNLPLAYQCIFFRILEHAVFKPTIFNDHGHLLDLEPGQLCISERELQKLCGKQISRGMVQRGLASLKSKGYLSQEVRHKKSILTIICSESSDFAKAQHQTSSQKKTEPRIEPRSAKKPSQQKSQESSQQKSLLTSKSSACYDEEKNKTEPTKEPRIEPGNLKTPSQESSHKRRSKEDISNDISRNSSTQSKNARSASPPRIDIYFSFETLKFENIQEDDLKSWKIAYPAAIIERELAQMAEWLKSNPTKAKSKKLWRKFITGWLNRANEKQINLSAYQSVKSNLAIDRRVKNKDGTFVEEPYYQNLF